MWNKVASIVMLLMVIGGCSQESQHKKEGSHLSKMTSLDIHDQEIKQLAEEFISLTLDDKIAAQNAMKSADWQAMLNNTTVFVQEMQKENARKTTIYDNIVNVISNSNSEYRRLAGWQGINAILPHVDMNKLKNLDTGSNVQMAMTAQYQRVILTGNALEGTGYITKSYNEVKDVLTQLIKQETDPEVMAEAKMAMRCLQAE